MHVETACRNARPVCCVVFTVSLLLVSTFSLVFPPLSLSNRLSLSCPTDCLFLLCTFVWFAGMNPLQNNELRMKASADILQCKRVLVIAAIFRLIQPRILLHCCCCCCVFASDHIFCRVVSLYTCLRCCRTVECMDGVLLYRTLTWCRCWLR